jgi:uncharacterized Zn-finger protein
MPNPHTADKQQEYKEPNAQQSVEVTQRDLPLHCPVPGSALWSSHPRVFLPIEDAKDKRMICPYCGTEYRLVD